MNKGSKIAMWVILSGAGLGLVALAIHNARNNESFFDASLTTCISIAVAIGISYLLVQKQTDKRKQKDILSGLLTNIQALISEKEAYIVNDQTTKESMTLRKRDISNRIDILKIHSKKFGIDPEVKFIVEKFTEYDRLIGDHIDNFPYLRESSMELRRPLELINSKLFELMVKLYT